MIRILACAAFALIACGACASAAVPAQVNFLAPDNVMQLQTLLSPYHGPTASGCADWYLMRAGNDSPRPATRVLQAGRPPGTGLEIFPAPTRPEITDVAASDPAVLVTREGAYGHRAFRVTLPPASRASLAICFSNAGKPPSLLAWTEPSLAQHNRNLAIFVAAVAGLIGACAAIVAGLAALNGHVAPRWAGATLFLVLFERLAATGMFDSSLATSHGGPYGLMSLIGGLALASGARLVNSVVPIREFESRLVRPFEIGMFILVALSVLAYLGFPAAAVITDGLVILGSALLAGWLVHCGRLGSPAARVLAPSAAVFALVVLAAAGAALAGFADNALAADAAGGFAAAGAVLLALAVAEDESFEAARDARGASAQRQTSDTLEGNRFADAVLASYQGVFDLDFVHNTLLLSGLSSISDGELRITHEEWITRIYPEDRLVYEQAFAQYRAKPGAGFRLEFRAQGGEAGSPRWLELRATMRGDGDIATRCIGLIADISARKENESATPARSLHDPLTGLGNRIALIEDLEQLGHGLSDAVFALLDIDRFKSIHASLGDEGGDFILKRLSERLNRRFGKAARVYRVGGDGFALVFTAATDTPVSLGGQLVECCGAAFQYQGREVFALASVGAARGSDAEDPLELLKNTELALLHAKRAGGGRASVYSPDLLAPTDSVALEADLRGALEKNQIDVYYQPIIRLSDRSVAGFEALLRWHHPVRGLISPDEFIAHSEETGLIVELGKLALQRATVELARWQRAQPRVPPLFVSVNVSRRQLRDEGFESLVRETLSRGEINRGTLRLEITESALATNPDAPYVLRRVRDLGAGLSIDDFGTGISSLSQLKELPFDTMKVDKSFLTRRSSAHGDADGVVLASIITLAHELKRSVVVEGVESERDAEWLTQLGCEFGQGFYFSVPLPANEAMQFLASQFATDGSRAAVTT